MKLKVMESLSRKGLTDTLLNILWTHSDVVLTKWNW